MSAERFMNRLLGIAALVFFLFFQLAIHDRDAARAENKATVAVNGTIVTVACKPQEQPE